MAAAKNRGKQPQRASKKTLSSLWAHPAAKAKKTDKALSPQKESPLKQKSSQQTSLSNSPKLQSAEKEELPCSLKRKSPDTPPGQAKCKAPRQEGAEPEAKEETGPSKTSFGCSKCRMCASGCLQCNPEKKIKWLAKKEAARLQGKGPDHVQNATDKEARKSSTDPSLTSMAGEDKTHSDVWWIPMDQVKGKPQRKRLIKRGSPAVDLPGDVKDEPTPHACKIPMDQVRVQGLRERLAHKKTAAKMMNEVKMKMSLKGVESMDEKWQSSTLRGSADTSPEIQTPPPPPPLHKLRETFRTPTPLTPGCTTRKRKLEEVRSVSTPTSTSKQGCRPSQPLGTAARDGTGSEVKPTQELKSLLTKNGIDFASCKEKTDLQALWDRAQDLRSKSLVELRKICITAGCAKLPNTVDGCIQTLLNNKDDEKNNIGTPCTGPIGSELARRQLDAAQECKRMLSLSKWSFTSNLAWGMAVLGAQGANIPAVQRAHRVLMKKLHPDKVGHSPDISDAIELAREARDTCERALSHQTTPSTPLYLRSTVLSAKPGCRRVRLQWEPPSDIAHVRKYVVSAFDATFNRAIPVATLEPDYNEEMKRFVCLEELRSYVVAEEDLQKLPGVFQRTCIVLQVAAANEMGQSPWASLRVPLKQ